MSDGFVKVNDEHSPGPWVRTDQIVAVEEGRFCDSCQSVKVTLENGTVVESDGGFTVQEFMQALRDATKTRRIGPGNDG